MMDKIEFSMGKLTSGEYPLLITVVIKKTWYNRLRFWLFFKFFPFEMRGWKEKENGNTTSG